MLLGQVLLPGLVQVRGQSCELQTLEVGAGAWVRDVRGWLVVARTGSCGAETWDLDRMR